MSWVLHESDCLDAMRAMPSASVDCVVTDPPYGLGYMGRQWDDSTPGVPHWTAALRVLKPGGYLLTMGSPRTYHRMACAVEDAGFEIRDCLMWLYGSGFPKSKACMKPAYEPIVLARRPGKVLPLGVAGCRVGVETRSNISNGNMGGRMRPCNRVDRGDGKTPDGRDLANLLAYLAVGAARPPVRVQGRWPANVAHDGGDEVTAAFGSTNAARFFYCAKSSKADRGAGNDHPTVKPSKLCEWLVRLVCPEGGIVLDPFAGSGSTGVAALAEGRRFVGVERDAGYAAIARDRLTAAEQRTTAAPAASLFA